MGRKGFQRQRTVCAVAFGMFQNGFDPPISGPQAGRIFQLVETQTDETQGHPVCERLLGIGDVRMRPEIAFHIGKERQLTLKQIGLERLRNGGGIIPPVMVEGPIEEHGFLDEGKDIQIE